MTRTGPAMPFPAGLLPRNPGTQSLDGPLEHWGRTLRSKPAVDHCEQIHVPLSARVVYGLQAGQQLPAEPDVVGAANDVRVVSR
jgi:hypothetical protein